MNIEIEKKYLVINTEYRKLSTDKYNIIQGYLQRDPKRTVRVRLKNEEAFLTIKGLTIHDKREEYEYKIPYNDGLRLIELCIPPVINKTRYIVPFYEFIWEVDEFQLPISMTLAEIELPSSETGYPIPSFIGREVTGKPEYHNSNIGNKSF